MIDINITSSVNYSEVVDFIRLKIFQRRISSTLTGKIWNFILTNHNFLSYFKSCLSKIDKKNKITGQKLRSVDVKISVAHDRNKIDEITLCFNTYENCKQTYTYIYPIPFNGIDTVSFMIKEGKSIKKLLDKEFLNWMDLWMDLVSFILLSLGIFPIFKYSENILNACISIFLLMLLYILLVNIRNYIRNKRCEVLHLKMDLRETPVIETVREKTNLAN